MSSSIPPSDPIAPIPQAPSTSTVHPASTSSLGHSTASNTVNGLPAAMPSHWENKYPGMWPCIQPIFYYTFKVLCLISVGRSDLKRKWGVVNLDDNESEFQKEKDRITAMVTTTNIVAGLLLASTAALLTTTPPRADVINYNTRGPYLCLFCPFGIIIGGIVVGCAVLFVLSAVSAEWTRDTIMATRLRIWIMLILLAYPFLSIGVGTTVNFMGLLAAAWMSGDHIANSGSAALLAVPVSLLGFFALISRKHKTSASHMKTDAEASGMTAITPTHTPPPGRHARASTL